MLNLNQAQKRSLFGLAAGLVSTILQLAASQAEPDTLAYDWGHFAPAYVAGVGVVIVSFVSFVFLTAGRLDPSLADEVDGVVPPDEAEVYLFWPPVEQRVTKFRALRVQDAPVGHCGWLTENAFLGFGRRDGVVMGDSQLRDTPISDTCIHVAICELPGHPQSFVVRPSKGFYAYSIRRVD